MLCALALPALKLPVGVDLRLGQLAVAGLFALIILRDLHHQQVAWGPLLAIAGGGLLLSGLSLLSVEPSVKEKVFVLKYVVVFPTAFYCGVRLPALAGVRRLTTAVEGTLAFGCLLSLALWLHPVPLLIHERPAYLSVGLKGSFWEQGELAFFAGLFLLASAGRRIEHGLRPRGRLGVIALALLYLLALGCALGSYNKTIWVALVAAWPVPGHGGLPAWRWWGRCCWPYTTPGCPVARSSSLPACWNTSGTLKGAPHFAWPGG
jgi:hypothetical protein